MTDIMIYIYIYIYTIIPVINLSLYILRDAIDAALILRYDKNWQKNMNGAEVVSQN